MKSRTTLFVLAIVGCAFVVPFWLPPLSASAAQEEGIAIVVLAALALVAEMLSFLLPKGATGSISSMPALAAVLISPTWQGVLAIAVVKALVESLRRAEFLKAVFNVAQYALSYGLAALVFLSMGGGSLIGLRDSNILTATRLYGVAAFVAFIAAVMLNTLSVSTVIALSTGTRVRSVWHATTIAKIGIDIIASPLVFMFAWAYIRFGPIAFAALWVPIIGLRQLYKTNIELEQTNVELLDLMVKSIEARDPYTSGHSRRVQEYSMMIGRALGLPEKEVQMVGRSALLHDVGKIHEKYGPILRKADNLTQAEWNVMREHPADGADLIATMTRLRELVAPVRGHHENWDGTGYPDGLAGELIPLASRIIRFADTIDAMTTERPYRRMLTSEEVRAELVRCRGTQFDPQIVDKLLSSGVWKTMFAHPGSASPRAAQLAVLPRYGERATRTVSRA
ncbi:MAG TPA: HD-GYP domain-containing protein [Gemmatimonadaceae bacterium]|nr:HD-GYP domain-containing protein [Gemmatimonadaceae bacterium]